LGVADVSQSEVTTLVVVDTRTNKIAGLWKGFQPTALAWVKDANMQPVLMHGTASGHIYDHGAPGGSLWTDQAHADDGGTQAITHKANGTPIAFHTSMVKHFSQIDLSLRVIGTQTLAVSYTSPNGTGPSQTVAAAPQTAVQWDGAWDGTWGGGVAEQHVVVGVDEEARWIAPQITHSILGEQFGLVGLGLRGYEVGEEVRAA